MNNNKETIEEEEIFADAVTSPEPELRRSARKRKSVSDGTEMDTTRTRSTGKHHRPLGNMAGVQRSPDQAQRKQTGSDKLPSNTPARKATNTAKPTLTVDTDPPTAAPTPEQMILLGGMRAVLRE